MKLLITIVFTVWNFAVVAFTMTFDKMVDKHTFIFIILMVLSINAVLYIIRDIILSNEIERLKK